MPGVRHFGRRGAARGLATWWVGLALGAAACGARADSLTFCEQPAAISPTQKDRLLRFAALVKDALDQSGQRLALIARSGTDLSRFDVRYSHAGVSLKASANGPWSVRQLYFACEESRPRLFDQGMAGFVFGTENPLSGYVSLVVLPEPQGRPLEQVALDNRRALQLLGPTYSANAHAFALTYQNCNQWVAELLADAWGTPATVPTTAPTEALAGDDAAGPDDLVPIRRASAQAWLKSRGYQPHRFELGWRPLVWLAGVLPWLHTDDHPADDLDGKRFQVSMPSSIEAFVRDQVPGAQRIELCHQGQRAVVRRGWQPIAAGCQPEAGDAVISLD